MSPQLALRPKNFDEYVGQDKVKKTLEIMIKSAAKRKAIFDHILIYGSSGMGKTTLAHLIAHESGRNLKFAQGPLIEKKADVLSLLGSLQKNDIIFIDEIHALNKNVEELIYSAMEEGVIDIIIGPEGNSKIVRMKLPPFSMIGATTKINLVSIPLRNRFGFVCKLQVYQISQIALIIKLLLQKLALPSSPRARHYIAQHCHHNPRLANHLVDRIVDYMTVHECSQVSMTIVKKTFALIGIYQYGLNEAHIEYLLMLYQSFTKSWAALENIASSLQLDKENTIVMIETTLLSLQLVTKSSRGRKITNKGISYLKTNKLV